MSQGTIKTNLFTSAKKKETPKESKSNIPSLKTTPELEEQIKNYTEAKAQFKDWEAKKELAEGAIKVKARELYLEQCKIQKRNIGSFKLLNVTVSVQDKYSKLEGELAKAVAENFPDVVETKTEYLFNQEILHKNISLINDALQNSGVPEEDLANLIEVKEVTLVKKGTIDTLPNYGEKMSDLFEAIAPVISMR